MSRTLIDLLLPRPLRAEQTAGAWRAGRQVRVDVPAGLGAGQPLAEVAARRLATALDEHRVETLRGGSLHGSPGGAADVRLRVAGQAAREATSAGDGAESYRLSVGPRGVEVDAADPQGLLHAAATMAQWLHVAARRRGEGLEVPALVVEDRPAFAHRGVVLDVSRDKVPRMATLFETVEMLAGWKINQLQLYTEHAFAYVGHETVWRGASPMTPAEVRELDAFCAERGVELVPNQNSFGHFHRWLVHEPYRRLAECPDGVEHPWSRVPEPFSLCATDPGSVDLLAELYGQLLPHFTSRQLNVGLDESFDLGRCRSAAACAERGRHHVYLDFLRAVHGLAAERGRRIQFWGDIVLEEPSLIPELPTDAVALAWGYEAGHPFAENAARFAAAGLDFYLCPGTSSWASLTGRVSNAVANVAEAATAGRDAGASGLLVTDWGDFGHLQPLPVSWPGLAAGAAAAWNPARPLSRSELPALLDAHVLRDPDVLRGPHHRRAAGRALCDLGDVHLTAGGGNVNGTALFHLLLHPERRMNEGRNESLGVDGLEAAVDRIEVALDDLADATLQRPDAARVAAEITWAADAVRFAARLALARLAAGRAEPVSALPAPRRTAFAGELDDLLDRRRTLWLTRNRPGGLPHAFAHLAPLRHLLAGG